VLVSMNGNRVDSFIDIQFDEDGSFHGTAGDRRYSGNWRARNDRDLRLTSIDTSSQRRRDDDTRQERRYLDKLENIERYTLERDRLVLIPQDRDNALVYERRSRVSWNRDRW
jgi:heat shock protein HslJ